MKFSLQAGYDPEKLAHLTSIKEANLPSTSKVIAWVTLLFLIGIGLFMSLVPWVQTVEGRGALVALDPTDREQAISALVPGRIAEWYVREGSQVAEGDPIARIEDNDPMLVDRLRQQITVAERNVAAARAALDTSRLNLTRNEELLKDGLVARRDFEQAQIRVTEREATLQTAQKDLNRAQVELSREGSQTVVAPRSGIITRVLAGGTATYVSAGQPLARFAPSDVERTVELYVDGLDAALLSPGKPVRLQFEGWPVIQFSGWPAIAVGTFAGEVRYVDPLASSNGLFRVVVDESTVEPWPDTRFLRLGTKAQGWVQLDEVLVGFELWRRLNGFPPEFKPGDAQLGAESSSSSGSSGS